MSRKLVERFIYLTKGFTIMKRIIIDYKIITKEIFNLLLKKYPNGYTNMDILSFRDKNKNLIEAVQVESDDTIYLVKVSKRLVDSMEDYNTEEDAYLQLDNQDLLFDTELPEDIDLEE